MRTSINLRAGYCDDWWSFFRLFFSFGGFGGAMENVSSSTQTTTSSGSTVINYNRTIQP